jgi:hypothetical protein
VFLGNQLELWILWETLKVDIVLFIKNLLEPGTEIL